MIKLSRRAFLKLIKRTLAATGLAAVFTPIIAYFYPPNLEEIPSEPVLVSPEKELDVNQSKTINFGRYPALVINTTEGLRAYSAVCTHFACIVKWDSASGQIICPCHDGFFDPFDGHVIAGPPPTPLEEFPIEVIDGNIYIGGTQ